MMRFSLLLQVSSLLITLSISTSYGYPSPQPVIGVLLESVLDSYRSCYGQYKVLSAYKYFVEQGGAGAVPIFVNQSDAYYEKLIPRLNGVLLTGGGVNLISSYYAKAAYKIFNMATKWNDAGTHFPIWGTCLGMEEMTTWPFNPPQIPITCNCYQTEGVGLALNFTADSKSSRLYGTLPDSLRDILGTEKITPNFHHCCLTKAAYDLSKELSEFYSVLSTNVDGKGVEFVSTLEARGYPFYGVQFHPEKMNFIHPVGYKVSQTLHSAMAGQYFGNFLVEEARKNKHTFNSVDEERKFLFNSYPTMFDDSYEYYCFNNSDVPEFDV